MSRYKKGKWILLSAVVLALAPLLILGNRAGNSRKTEPATVIADTQYLKNIEPVSGQAVFTAPEPTANPEDGVYSFLQGPKSWKQRRAWSGKWGVEFYDGRSFGGFGCGLCGMANIYCTLTPYKCTPFDMYQWTKKNTYYGGGGAIAWQFMRRAMAQLGFEVKLGEKPSSYGKFQAAMSESQSMLVLVSSYEDDSYWQDTPGHYVTLFLYNSDTDEAFLTDSGDPKHNRRWAPLKTIYKALKTSSDFQYMSVISYEEAKDKWKHASADGAWVRPEA